MDNLAQDGIDAFPHLKSEFPSLDEAQLLLRNCVYPYDYMDSADRFEEAQLPSIEAFYSQVKRESVSKVDYAHAQNVSKTFDMRNMGSYHDLYLQMDIVLLCDVFEAFRNVCMRQYELDPCHFYTSPGLSWASCLKMTDVQLQLMTDIDQILFIEKGIRGGVSQISNRYKAANNPYLDKYDSSKVTSHLQYLDANSLYGWSMIQPLPVSDFRFLDETEIQSLDIRSIPEDGNRGYIFEVSLKYPDHLHDQHNDKMLNTYLHTRSTY